MKEKLLKTPQGAESIFLDEAYKHEKINEVINNIYTTWGYLPIKTPVFDYYETYEKLLSAESKKNCFRLMDRDGELLLLRNDITLFLARQLGRVAKKDDVIRVHYADSILRHQSEIDISSNEFFQTGADLVGAKGMDGDLEAITLLHKIFMDLELAETKIHLGSRSLLDEVVHNFPTVDIDRLISLINLRDPEALTTYLESFANSTIAHKITKLFLFIGTFEEFNDFVSINEKLLLELNITKSIKYLHNIGKTLLDIKIIDDFRFDLSEVANRDYYTGIVFKAYTKDIDSAIASGGRYDNLISSFGEKIPSVGFSILLRKIEHKINSDRFNPPETVIMDGLNGFSAKYLRAEELRSSGKCVIIKGENI